MARMLDCLVNYFGLDENDQPGFRRYFCYHVIGGPGPTEEDGVATITTLAVHSEGERCTYCDTFHTVERGGPAAAVAKAIRYLDDVHRGLHVRKVQTEVRGPGEVRLSGARPPVSHAELDPAPWR
jgi:hypothetical protein